MKKVTNGKKDILGNPILAFNGNRECESGSELRMYHHRDGKIATKFSHHDIVDLLVEVKEFEADPKTPAFKTLNISGRDANGNGVEVTLFLDADKKINFNIVK